MHKKPLILALLTGIALSGAAQAALHDRGGGMIYDDVLDITWLSDANYAATQFANSAGTLGDADGRMNWADANAWAAGLSYGGYEDWRLPTALNQDGSGPCSGGSCTGSEMGYMYYTNLSATGVSHPGEGNTVIVTGANTANLALFTNLGGTHPLDTFYWSGSESAPGSDNAWSFLMLIGHQQEIDKAFVIGAAAWAVRIGDVAAVPVPEPETYALMLAGLGLVGWAAKRRRS